MTADLQPTSPPPRSCNLHADCNAADEKARANGRACAEHCNNEALASYAVTKRAYQVCATQLREAVRALSDHHEPVEAAARALWRLGNARIGERPWESVAAHYLAEAKAALEAAGMRPSRAVHPADVLGWDSLCEVVTAYVSDRQPANGGDSPQAVVVAAIGRLRRAVRLAANDCVGGPERPA